MPLEEVGEEEEEVHCPPTVVVGEVVEEVVAGAWLMCSTAHPQKICWPKLQQKRINDSVMALEQKEDIMYPSQL